MFFSCFFYERFILNILLGNNCSYYPIQRSWYTKKHIQPSKVLPDDEVVVQLMKALNYSFDNLPQLSEVRLIVTVDLRRGDVKRAVFNMENVNCKEATACLALGIIKRTPDARVFSFSAKKRLMPLELLASDTYELALRKCTALSVIYKNFMFSIKLVIYLK